MWEPGRLIILRASTACYRDSFTFFYYAPGIAVYMLQTPFAHLHLQKLAVVLILKQK
jgi:hypothetical protein